MDISLSMKEISNTSMVVKTMNGTEMMLIKLIKAVRDTERATSPSANFVKTFEVNSKIFYCIIFTCFCCNIY